MTTKPQKIEGGKKLCGIRPTGRLHLGHYFSVIKPALELGADVLVADYHAPKDEGDLMEAQLGLFGIKVIRQKDVFNPKLYFGLLNLAKIGELERMTQYKSAKIKTAHLLTYPVLMAHDVIGYGEVIVGDDQRQHLEYAKVLLKRGNALYIPKGVYIGGRIMSLTDPTKKMSKSEPSGCIFLDEDPTEKIMRAVTTAEGVKNLKEMSLKLGVKYDESKNEESKRLLIKEIIKISKHP